MENRRLKYLKGKTVMLTNICINSCKNNSWLILKKGQFDKNVSTDKVYVAFVNYAMLLATKEN